jgi:hypothetical protein
MHVHIDLLMKQIDLHDPSSSYYNVKKMCLKYNVFEYFDDV